MHNRPSIRLLGLLLIISQGAAGQDSRLVDIGGHSLNYMMAGEGEPAVVFETGLANSFSVWKRIIDSVSAFTRVVAYDRAGYGQSGEGPYPRNAKQEADELKALLDKLGISSPVVIVGHSLGGLNAQYFAKTFPDRVAGLILLDPPPLKWITGKVRFPHLDSMAAQQTQQFISMGKSVGAQAGFFRTLASEHEEMFGSSGVAVGAIDSFSDLPLTVIASGKPNPAFGETAARFQDFWIAESRDLARKSSSKHFVLLKESSHQFNMDAPAHVISEIRDMVAGLRKK